MLPGSQPLRPPPAAPTTLLRPPPTGQGAQDTPQISQPACPPLAQTPACQPGRLDFSPPVERQRGLSCRPHLLRGARYSYESPATAPAQHSSRCRKCAEGGAGARAHVGVGVLATAGAHGVGAVQGITPGRGGRGQAEAGRRGGGKRQLPVWRAREGGGEGAAGVGCPACWLPAAAQTFY